MSRYDIDNYMPLLQEYSRTCATGYVLELGIGQADGSTKAFIDGLEQRGGDDRLMVSVDHQVDFNEQAPTVSYWRFVWGSSIDPKTFDKVIGIDGGGYRIEKDFSSWRVPDIIFIDTEHTYEQMAMELEIWGPLGGSHTTWLFHDTYMFGGYNLMTDAIKEYAAANGWVYDDVSVEAHGLGRMRRGK